MSLLSQIHPLSIAACVLLSMGLGAVWFSPMLFGNRWALLAKMTDMPKEQMQKMMPRCLVISLVSCTLMSTAFALLLTVTPDVVSIVDAIELAVLIWLAFIATTFGTSYAYTGKPLELFFIDTGYPLVSLVIIAVTLKTLGL